MPQFDFAEVARLAADRMLMRLGRRQQAQLPEDPPEPPPPEPRAPEPAIPTTVFIRYAASGDVSERAVSLRTIWRDGDVIYFRGVCHLRSAVRAFRADRVQELICLATGEVADDPAAWLADHALFEAERRADPTGAALKACRDELTVLAYLARADGQLDPDEVEVAIDVVMMATEDEIHRHRVASQVRRLTPSADDIEPAIGRIAANPQRLAAFRRAKRRLVDADGRLDVGEQLAAAEIAAYIAARLDG